MPRRCSDGKTSRPGSPEATALVNLVARYLSPVGESRFFGHADRFVEHAASRGGRYLHPSGADIIAVDALLLYGFGNHLGVGVRRSYVSAGKFVGQGIP